MIDVNIPILNVKKNFREKKLFFVDILMPLNKRAGSGPDPYQNVAAREH
jgi:hypothetical protein